MLRKNIIISLLLLLVLVGCQTSDHLLTPAVYFDGDFVIEIKHDGEMGVAFQLNDGGGLIDYEYVSDDIYQLNFGDDLKSIDESYYLKEKEEVLELISKDNTLEDIKAGNYTPDHVLLKKKTK